MVRPAVLAAAFAALVAGCNATKSNGSEPAAATEIAWASYDEGLATAAREHKPVCLVFSTSWCPHCKNFSQVLKDPRVVEAAKRLVMIRLDQDQRPDLSRKYAPDGEYVPRTLFLEPGGAVAAGIHAPRPNYRYFYDERDPRSILSAMDEAARTLN